MGGGPVGPTPPTAGKGLRDIGAEVAAWHRRRWVAFSSIQRFGSRLQVPPVAMTSPSPSLSGERRRSHHQIPSEYDAPRRSPPQSEHLPPWSLTEPSSREPPRPLWFSHQSQRFRHLLHALRCALDDPTRGFETAGTSARAAPWILSVQRSTSTPRASLDSDPGHWPAACVG